MAKKWATIKRKMKEPPIPESDLIEQIKKMRRYDHYTDRGWGDECNCSSIMDWCKNGTYVEFDEVLRIVREHDEGIRNK